MSEFVFAWTVKEVIKACLSAYLGFSLLTVIITMLCLGGMQDLKDDVLYSLRLGLFIISPAIIIVSAIVTYIARFCYWVIEIW